jgi:hypothetical protein
MKKIAVIAPHSDDAALSLGGFLIKSNFIKEIVNIFSTCAFSIIPKLKNPEEITLMNNKEECLFAQKIKAKLYFLGKNEALLRGYRHWKGKINKKKDGKILNEILGFIKERAINWHEIYFPIGIGNHIDHKIIFEIGKYLTRKLSKKIYFYEDLPYAAELPEEEVKKYLTQFKESRYFNISHVIDKKIKLCSIYKTQYSKDYLQILKIYARKISPASRKILYCERVWSF